MRATAFARLTRTRDRLHALSQRIEKNQLTREAK
jgi:hypothetical protein